MQPKVNQILYLQVASADEEASKINYKARIADYREQDLLIEVPINEENGKLKKLYLGDELSAYFLNENGVKHYFNSHVLGFREDVIKLISIRKPDPDQVTKVQRRSFFRVPAELELAVKLPDQTRFLAYTDDVGGGGISFLADGKWQVKEGETLECWMLLSYKNGSLDHSGFVSEVVRVEKLESGRIQVMCKFAQINDSERQRIIRYCFERQLDFRNR
ncbi:flagellar brake protein [Paenibacillus sp. GCM10012307]|uniref:Flagellar brake domain-containing protein n=1 Tax=Paenibacillus roseus TaxID=2798579 RepID=A0A934J827_9BACL|nr:flagellar brake domain-containing protein [Paenibacillus roseus]MBJ6363499.1 flagellar brake domain-containing protein [Paenibacillus roseus]